MKKRYETISAIADSQKDQIEFWHKEGNRGWRTEKPQPAEIRIPGAMHVSSTLYMGDDEHAAVNTNYAPYGCRNVYVTGSALFPTAGMLLGSALPIAN